MKAGAPGQDCTDTKRGLSPLPLPWATGAEMVLALKTREPAVNTAASLSPGQDPQRPISAQTNWCRVRDFHPQPLRPERSASGSWANAAKWYSRQESHLQPDGSKPPALIV